MQHRTTNHPPMKNSLKDSCFTICITAVRGKQHRESLTRERCGCSFRNRISGQKKSKLNPGRSLRSHGEANLANLLYRYHAMSLLVAIAVCFLFFIFAMQHLASPAPSTAMKLVAG